MIQLNIRDPTRVTSTKLLIEMPKEDLINFKYISSEGKIPLSFNRAEISLIRALKEHI